MYPTFEEGENMKKPFNKFALLLWVLAVLAPIIRVAGIGRIYQTLLRSPPPTGQSVNNILVYSTAAAEISGILLTFGQLAALAIIIELIDQIRWNATHSRTGP